MGYPVNCTLSLSDFNQTGMLVKFPSTKFSEDRFSGSRIVTDGRTDTHAVTNGHTFAAFRCESAKI